MFWRNFAATSVICASGMPRTSTSMLKRLLISDSTSTRRGRTFKILKTLDDASDYAGTASAVTRSLHRDIDWVSIESSYTRSLMAKTIKPRLPLEAGQVIAIRCMK